MFLGPLSLQGSACPAWDGWRLEVGIMILCYRVHAHVERARESERGKHARTVGAL